MMTIHVVQQGETINSIADYYQVPVNRIISENGLENLSSIVPGEAIVITFPETTYIVQDGDTLLGIASNNGISIMQLLRNNPYLSDREYIYPGETLVVSYGEKIGVITTNGFTNLFIDRSILRKTLPFLTYLSIFGYRIMEDGEINEIEDTEVIQIAKNYGVAPLMTLSTLSTLGEENVEAAYNILNNEEIMDRLIDNAIIILKNKGYYGLNVTYQLLNNSTLSSYETFNTKAYNRLKAEGLGYFITISPNTIFSADKITFEEVDYSNILQESDGATILNYSWGTYLGPPAPIASAQNISAFLDYLLPQALPSKLTIGMPLLGYDWELPYNIGLSRALSLSLDAVSVLVRDVGSIIQFDEPSQTPFFTYSITIGRIVREHVIWFVDGRSFEAIMNIITARGLAGSGLWNIMRYVPQLWLVINNQYDIERIPENNF